MNEFQELWKEYLHTMLVTGLSSEEILAHKAGFFYGALRTLDLIDQQQNRAISLDDIPDFIKICKTEIMKTLIDQIDSN